MAVTVPYSEDTVTIPSYLLDGNESSDDPLQFDIAPAWGPDAARMRSITTAIEPLSDTNGRWSPAAQEATVQGFELGLPGFIQPVQAARG